MSRTTRANGYRVYHALLSLGWEDRDDLRNWYTLTEIASRAGVSKPTAKRYLDIFCAAECVWQVNRFGRVFVYRKWDTNE